MSRSLNRNAPIDGPGKRFSLLLFDDAIPGRLKQLVGTDLRIDGGWNQFAGGGGGVVLQRLLYYFAEEGGPWEGFDGAYEEYLPAVDLLPTSVTWYTDPGKTAKIVETTITYNGNLTINTENTKVYSVDGVTVAAEATDTWVYSGIVPLSRTRSVTVTISLPVQQLNFLAAEGGPWEGFDGAYQEYLPAGDPFPTSIIWYTDSGKTAKIVEEQITYNGNNTIATDTWILYDTDGSTVLVTAVDTYTYSGVTVLSRTRSVT